MNISPPRHPRLEALCGALPPHNGSLSEVAVRARSACEKKIEARESDRLRQNLACDGLLGIRSYVSRQSPRLGSADVLGCLLDDGALVFCSKKPKPQLATSNAHLPNGKASSLPDT
ncbi:hypothetical protein PspLS_00975 [Pyricularia sp. CBS 133598]|nr:hypothetical protein PspLS_00975 [Pyricularia sp. CBS 133598]